MTDKRKDEMPDFIYYDGSDAWTAARHSNCYKYIRADLSPPLPDDVAEIGEAIEHFEEKYIPSFSKKSKRLLKVLINAAKARQNYQDLWIAESKARRAASTPDAGKVDALVKALEHYAEEADNIFDFARTPALKGTSIAHRALAAFRKGE